MVLITLQSFIVPDTTPSQVVQNLMEKRQNEHDAAIAEMRKIMSEVNQGVEEEIKRLADGFKADLESYGIEANVYLKNVTGVSKGVSFQINNSSSHTFCYYVVVEDIAENVKKTTVSPTFFLH